MINKISILACFALSFLFVSPTHSQTPGQARVDALVDQIYSCKKDVVVLEAELNYMEKHPGTTRLERYLKTKKKLEEAKDCIKKAREELDELRKYSPELFNQPGVNIPLSEGHEISPGVHETSPGQLEKLVADLEKAIADYNKRMEKIQKPE